MSDKRPEDLSVEELRRLLLDKRRVSRKDRLDSFRRSGRVLALTPEIEVEIGRVVETPESGDLPEPEVPQSKRRVVMDRVLLGVEILAVVGLIGVIFVFFSMWQTLNQQAVASFQQPTAAPTALITAVV